MTLNGKMDAQLDVSSAGRVLHLEVLEGPTGRKQRSGPGSRRRASGLGCLYLMSRGAIPPALQPGKHRQSLEPEQKALASRAAPEFKTAA